MTCHVRRPVVQSVFFFTMLSCHDRVPPSMFFPPDPYDPTYVTIEFVLDLCRFSSWYSLDMHKVLTVQPDHVFPNLRGTLSQSRRRNTSIHKNMKSNHRSSIGGNTGPQVRLHISVTEHPQCKQAWKRTHSFATGPVIAEPFISPFGFTMTPALSSK